MHTNWSNYVSCKVDIKIELMAVLKVEADITANIEACQIGWAVIMYVETLKTDIIVIIGNIIMSCHIDRLFSVSYSVCWYWKYHSVRSMDINYQ